MKINFVDADHLLLNGESQPLEKFAQLQAQEFSLEDKQGSFDLVLKSNPKTVVSLIKKKVFIEYFAQK